jgi:hypothetical protein
MAAALEVDASTIRRWIAADHIPGPAAVALRLLEKHPPKAEARRRGVAQHGRAKGS